jgi:hypothetical protein
MEDVQYVKLKMNQIFLTYNTSKIQVTEHDFVSVQLLEYTVAVNNIAATVLLDSGANASFVDYGFLKRNYLNRMIEDRGSNFHVTLAGSGSSARCYGSVILPVKIGGIVFKLFFYVMDLQQIDLCFGLGWHIQFNPTFNYKNHDCSFVYKDQLIIFSGKRRPFRSNVVRINPPEIKIELLDADEFFGIHDDHPLLYKIELRVQEIELVNDATTIQKKKAAILREMEEKNESHRGIQVDQTIEDIVNWESIPKSLKDVLHQFKHLFTPMPYGPMKRDVYHYIPLDANAKIPHKKQYRLSFTESNELRRQLDQLLEKGWIQPSSSPYGAPVLFAAKKNGRLRMCVDYRELNAITLKDKYAIPLVQDCFDCLVGSTIFSTIDLTSGYYQVPIWPADVPKTAMNTKFGSFEWLVMPFGLTSAPSTFQRLVNHTLHSLLGRCVVVYLDDILIFSKSLEEHVDHVNQVMSLLREANLLCQPTKCQFGVPRLEFLGHVVSDKGLEMDPKKVDIVKNWPEPKNISDLRSFVGLCNYYRNFIHQFAFKAAPLTKLFGKGIWNWTEECNQSFMTLKNALTTAPVLILPDPLKPFFMFFDSSQLTSLGGVLCQLGVDGDLHPVAFESRKLTDAEKRYPVHELETLAFVHCLKQWRVYLHALKFFVYTDNRSIETIITNRNPSLRVIRWIDWLQSYQFDIRHIPRAKNTVADAMSKCGHASLPSEEELDLDESYPVLSHNTIAIFNELSFDKSLFDRIRLAYRDDPFWLPIIEQLEKQESYVFNATSRFAIGLDFILEDGLLWDDSSLGRLVLPDKDEVFRLVMAQLHDSPLAGHRGIYRTIAEFDKYFIMEKSRRKIRDYIQSCDSCQRIKATNRGTPGLLQPLAIPVGRWSHISMDFIVSLPVTARQTDSIFVVVDRFTKRAHFIPHKMTDSAEEIALIFLREVVRLHGLPISIVSDRDARFMSSFWGSLLKLLNISRDASSSMHPQTDGQTERVNRVLEETLRHYVNFRRDDWDVLLPCAEFAYNSSVQSAIKMTPFEADIGFTPSTFWTWSDRKSIKNESALLLTSKLKQVGEFVKSALKVAAGRMKFYADKKRVDVQYDVNDLVLVDRTRFSIDAFKEFKKTKFLPKYVGPFKVIERIGRLAYRLDIPSRSRAHNVFHVSNLKKYTISDSTKRTVTMPDPVLVKGFEEYEVEKILDCKVSRRRKLYLVKWKGYELHDATWEPLSNLANAQKLIDEFEMNLLNHHTRFSLVGENVTVTGDDQQNVLLAQSISTDRFIERLI